MTARFTVAYWCVLVAGLLPLLCSSLGKFGFQAKSRRDGGYDNDHPRAWWAQQTDWRARAHAAQLNGFEGLPLFIAGVLIAQQMGAVQIRVDMLAFAYVFLRLLYTAMYIMGLSTARSLIWGLAFLVNLALFFVAYR